jgi:hypothetical protein
MSHVQQLLQQLQQKQSAMAAMQKEAEWKDQQFTLMHKEYNSLINECLPPPQMEDQDAMQPVQQGDDNDDDTEVQIVEQLLQFEREVQWFQNVNKQHVGIGLL